ncbi:tetratricopeptide repeat protein [Candidatus Halobeggiatoa sp. HSG11]|nr:tetratricopeptide repeat protein [Candidatus Halobeggiatoa sp. HSG11]
MMKLIILLLLSVSVQAGTQQTTGNCSPVIDDTKIGGSVTIICNGIPQRVVDRLLKDLDERDLTLEEKNKELDELADRYRSLEQEVERFKRDNVDDKNIQGFVEQALVALRKGDFAEAERLAGELLDKHLENKVTQAASANFIKGQALSLQFKPVQALPYLKKAYNYRSENGEYAFAYAFLLAKQRQFKPAIPIYEDILQIIRESGDEHNVADTLNNLAILYKDTNRYELAEKHYLEALRIRRKLAKTNTKAYKPDVAMTLNNLANLYSNTNRYELAEKHYLEALRIRRKLAKTNPKTYKPHVAMTLNNLAILLNDTRRYELAEKHYLEALNIRRKLAQANPKAYKSDVAITLNNFALLLNETNHYKLAEKHYLEALDIRRKLAQANPKAYLYDVATTLNNLAILYKNTNRYELAEKHYLEALRIRRKLAQANPTAYLSYVARTLNNLANLYSKTNRYELAEKHYLEALRIRRKLAQTNPNAYEPYVADILYNSGKFYFFELEDKITAYKYFSETLIIQRNWYKKYPKLYATKLFLTLVLTAMTTKNNPCSLLKESLSIAPSEEWKQKILKKGAKCQLQN